jgi:hypothetical protein
MELVLTYLLHVTRLAPLAAGGLPAGQVAGVGVAAVLFRAVLRTRWLPVLAFAGLAGVTAGGGLLLAMSPGSALPIVAGAGLLLGFGAGAGVTPGLFMAGLSVPSNRLGPTFALVELLRSEAAFLLAPIMLRLAMTGGNLAHGVWLSSLVVLVLAGAGFLVLMGLLLLGGIRPHRPDVAAWLSGESAAFDSAPLAAAVRSN